MSIRRIQSETSVALQSMRTGQDEVTAGTALADEAGGALRNVLENARHLSEAVQEFRGTEATPERVA